jgi:hypothetical protein
MDRAMFDAQDFAVVADDDILVSPDVLFWFEWAANRFQYDDHIMAVSAYQPKDQESSDLAAAFTAPWFKALVWGTWVEEWFGDIDSGRGPSFRDTWDHDYSTAEDLGGAWGDGKAGYDWNIALRVRGDREQAYPAVSRAQHIGKFGGTHCTVEMFDDHLCAHYNESSVVREFELIGSLPWPETAVKTGR